MKKIFCSVFAVVYFLILTNEIYAKDHLVKITDNIYSYVDAEKPTPATSYGANAGIVVGEEAVLVIDTLISSKEAKKFINDIKEVTGKPVRYVVNTHYHLDHSLGNSEFKKLGANIISQSNCKSKMEETQETNIKNAKDYGLTENDMEGTVIAYPDITFSEEMEVDLGGLKVKLIYVTHSHTTGSAIIYIPARKTLFTGDILFTDFHPYMADGNIDGWIRTLDYILTLNPDYIIPGHGPVSGNKEIKDMKQYLIAFDKNAKKLANESNDLETIVTRIKKILPSRSRGDFLIKPNIQMRYLKQD